MCLGQDDMIDELDESLDVEEEFDDKDNEDSKACKLLQINAIRDLYGHLIGGAAADSFYVYKGRTRILYLTMISNAYVLL